MDTGFYVGPVGSLVQLPDVAADVDVASARIGGAGRSLMGRAWRDTLGYQRTWTWKWADLLPAQTAYLDAVANGLVPGPLRLVDPRRTNRLPEQQASGGSRSRSADGFAVTLGGLTYRDLGKVEPVPQTLGPWQLLRGCVEWSRSTGGAGSLFLTGPEADGTWRCPITPRRDIVELSAWVAGKAGLPVALEWTEWDRAGTARNYSSTAAGASVALEAGRWQQLIVNVAPAADAVAMMPRLTTATGAASGSVLTTAWQLAALDAEEQPPGSWSGRVPPELAAGWRIGGGAPAVVADPSGGAYPRFGFHDAGLVLVETT